MVNIPAETGIVAVAARRSLADNSRAVLIRFQPKEVAFGSVTQLDGD
jgi:hypothetical protein